MSPVITVAGEALIDLVIGADGTVSAARGGAPYNTAIAAARLGVDVEFLGTVSLDRFGRLLADGLATDGVTIAAERVDVPTTLAAAEIDEHGAASYRFYIDGTSAPALAGRVEDPTRADGVFTGGLGLVLQPMADTILDTVAILPAETMVVFDVNCRPKVVTDRSGYLDRVHRLFERADVVKVSDDDLRYLAPDADTLDAARDVLEAGPSAVLVTAGAATTSIVTAAGVESVPVPALSAPVVDSIGAGDTFGGGFLAWWTLSGLGRDDLEVERLRAAVEAAHAAAGIVVTRRGADPPRRADLPADWHRAAP